MEEEMEYLDDDILEPIDLNKIKWEGFDPEEIEDHPDFEEFDEDYLMSEPWNESEIEDEDEEYLKETTSEDYIE